MSASTQPVKRTSFLRKHGVKLVALIFWLGLIGSYWAYTRANNLTAADSIRQVANLLTSTAWGPLIYIALYILRPLIFFPATLVTLLSGFLFGPIGILYTIIGSNSSALLAFFVGQYFGKGLLDSEESAGLVQRYAQRMRDNSFETVLLMRLLFLPYDLVHYVAGFLRIDWKAFLLATIIGSIPGTISFVLLGGSFGTLDALLQGEISVNPWALGLSIGLIVISIALSRFLKRREAAPDPNTQS